MTPRPDELDGPVAELVRELGTWRTAPAPAPGAALRELFAQMAAVTPPAAATPRRTPMSESKRLLAAVPAKIAAGVVGALLAGSLGAGAMTGTIQLTSEQEPAAEVGSGTVELEDESGGDPPADGATDLDGSVEDEGEGEDKAVEEDATVDDTDDLDDTGGHGPKEAGDPATAPVPTSVSEAAKNHQFDEACGNHGAYVSHFARTGEEPECATAAREGATQEPSTTEVEAGEPSDAAAEAPAPKSHPEQSKASPTGVERSEAGKARAAANKANAGGRSSGGAGKGKAGR